MSSVFPLLLLLAAPDSRIDKVTVLADRAEVVRVNSAACAAGKAEVVVGGLPSTVDERTIQATAQGAARAIGSTSRIVPPAAGEASSRRKALELAMVAVQDKLRTLEDKRRTLGEEVAQLAAYARYTDPLMREEMRTGKPSPEAWKKTLDTLGSRQLELEKQQLALDPERRTLERELARLQLRLGMVGDDGDESTREVTVAVDCAGESTARVGVSYVVPSATWHPEYEIRFVPERAGKTGKGTVEITVAAVVSQSTGEDWTEASIVLSTSKPRLGAEAPLPARITVDGQEASDDKVLVQGVEDRSSLAASSGPASGAGPSRVDLDDGGRAFTLTFPGRATVLSDGRPYWMPVDEVKGRAEVRLVTIPKLSPHVFQALSFENPARYPLIAGRARMHRGPSYVGDVALDHTASGAPVELSLGIEGELRVDRKDMKDLDRSPGFLERSRELERELVFVLGNQSLSAESVVLRENIPVSKDAELKVELDTKKSTAGLRHDVTRGFLEWTVDVPKGGEKKVNLRYVVRLPKSWKVQ
jgi:uncharacterized protein (TIGR02231 family)